MLNERIETAPLFPSSRFTHPSPSVSPRLVPTTYEQRTMSTIVLPGQPLSALSTTASLLAGPGTFARGGAIYSSLIGQVSRDGGVSPTVTSWAHLQAV